MLAGLYVRNNNNNQAIGHLSDFLVHSKQCSCWFTQTLGVQNISPDKEHLSGQKILPAMEKIYQDLIRFAIQAKGPDGKWTRKPLAYRESNNVHLLITRPPEICVNLVFKHIHAASSYTICRQFVPFIYCPL